MKKNYLRIIPLIAFTLVGCTGGVTIKDTTGNKVTFKSEDVRCDDLIGGSHTYSCRANGVVEDLAGNKYAKSYINAFCITDWKKSETNIACVAGLKFGLY